MPWAIAFSSPESSGRNYSRSRSFQKPRNINNQLLAGGSAQCHLVFVPPRQSIESTVAQALLPAASALLPTLGLPGGEGYGETSGGSSNNISPLKCLRHQKLSGRRKRLPHSERVNETSAARYLSSVRTRNAPSAPTAQARQQPGWEGPPVSRHGKAPCSPCEPDTLRR